MVRHAYYERIVKGLMKHDDRMNGFWRFFDRLLDMMAGLAGTILIFITAAVCYTIGMRYLFTKTTIWIMPMTEYALLWIVFLATARLLRDGGHVITEILYAHLNAKTKRSLDCIMFVIGGLACAIMVLLGSHHMYECFVNNVTDVRAVTVPKSAVFSIVPFGSLFLTIQFLRMAWDRLVQIRK
jgi:TRAP-type C4-dicarboxylate transport system permease small subunit